MSFKGFGQSQLNIESLAKLVVHYCNLRYPEALDRIFDNLPMNVNEEVLAGTIKLLNKDIDALGWFCGYMASEINCSNDNHRSIHPITELSKILIKAGMQPFVDFMPYIGCRLIIDNIDKFTALPESTKIALQYYRVVENSLEQFKHTNDALMSEMMVER